jgi:hypothetical protein
MPPKLLNTVKDGPKIYLKVPFADKDAVKALGAWWDMPNKCWYIPHTLAKDPAAVDKFKKWVPPPGTVVVAPVPAPVAAAAALAVVQPSHELLSALGTKRDYSLIPKPGASGVPVQGGNGGVEIPQIPSVLLYKLKEKSTADLARILVALGVKLPLGLDAEELLEMIKQHGDKLHLDKTPPPPAGLKPLRELTEHELFMQQLEAKRKAEEKAKKLKERGEREVINPEPGVGFQPRPKKQKVAKEPVVEEMTEERRAFLERLEDDDYGEIR